jgi:hypothetical protein
VPNVHKWSDFVFTIWKQLHDNGNWAGNGLTIFPKGLNIEAMKHSGLNPSVNGLTKMINWLNYVVLIGTELPMDTSRIAATCVERGPLALFGLPGWQQRLTFPVGHWQVDAAGSPTF